MNTLFFLIFIIQVCSCIFFGCHVAHVKQFSHWYNLKALAQVGRRHKVLTLSHILVIYGLFLLAYFIGSFVLLLFLLQS